MGSNRSGSHCGAARVVNVTLPMDISEEPDAADQEDAENQEGEVPPQPTDQPQADEHEAENAEGDQEMQGAEQHAENEEGLKRPETTQPESLPKRAKTLGRNAAI